MSEIDGSLAWRRQSDEGWRDGDGGQRRQRESEFERESADLRRRMRDVETRAAKSE